MPNIKRVVTIVIFIFATFIIGLFLYTIFFQPLTTETNVPPAGGGQPIGGDPGLIGNSNARLPGGTVPSPTPTETPSPQPSAAGGTATGGLTQVFPAITTVSDGVTMDRDGSSLVYYDVSDGKFYRLTKDGKIQTLNDRIFHDVQKITWSDDRQRAVLECPDSANIIFDFASGKQVSLPNHWEDFDFSPAGDQIIAKSIGMDSGNRWLVVTDATGSKERPIAPLGNIADSVITAWSPSNQMVAIKVQGSGASEQELFFVGLNDERYRSTVVPGLGFEGNYTPDGNQLLYSVYSSRTQVKPELWLTSVSPDAIGENRRTVGLQTWAHKCTFADASVAYCAVPETLPVGAGMYPNESDNSADQLYRVDLLNGGTTLVALPELGHTMESLTVSSDGRNLYYTAKQDSKVYRIQLK